ncbi:hypothetical protein PC128_g18958 [Phytophthora cactorum]|nr:hypothetical protein PC128_g18958 [Phytophthora cactorum]
MKRPQASAVLPVALLELQPQQGMLEEHPKARTTLEQANVSGGAGGAVSRDY